eukprot:scaffold4481_cov121-Cylindrotheca_fusiformis.AAC.8
MASSVHSKVALWLIVGLCILAYVLDTPVQENVLEGVIQGKEDNTQENLPEGVIQEREDKTQENVPEGAIQGKEDKTQENVPEGAIQGKEDNTQETVLGGVIQGKEQTTLSPLCHSKEEEHALFHNIRRKLKTRQFQFEDDGKMVPKQALHLHTMKTGGTSIDNFMRCAIRRQRVKIPYYSIHECSRTMFASCLKNPHHSCRRSMNNSAVMSFCSSLRNLDFFGWNTTNLAAFTELRHPVDRVWSMYRFQTKSCYLCKNLTDIYHELDNGGGAYFDDLCVSELYNKEVERLISTDFADDGPPDEIVAEAIENMKSFFSVIGITEELEKTSQVLGKVFPWMERKIEGNPRVCEIGKDNSSPKNNRCGPGGTHWDLPSHPDEATRKVIEQHNQLDMKLYEAAVQYFEMQWRALEMGELE